MADRTSRIVAELEIMLKAPLEKKFSISVGVIFLVIFMKVDNISSIACVEFFFLKKEFNLTINMQLLYFITTVTSQVQSAGHHQRAGLQCSTERLVKSRHYRIWSTTVSYQSSSVNCLLVMAPLGEPPPSLQIRFMHSCIIHIFNKKPRNPKKKKLNLHSNCY